MKSRIALLVDYDNAQIAAYKAALKRCNPSSLWAKPLISAIERSCNGQIDIRRVYGDTMSNVVDALREKVFHGPTLRDLMLQDVDAQYDLNRHGFRVIHCPTLTGRKNRADILMVLDCMEIVSAHPHIDTFALLSQDSDFSPLIQRLRAMGKRVALVTVGNVPDEQVRSLAALASLRVNYDQHAIDDCGPLTIKELLAEFQTKPDVVTCEGLTLGVLGNQIYERRPDFYLQDLGFQNFSSFVDACMEPPFALVGDRVFVQGKKPKPPLPKPAPSSVSQPAPPAALASSKPAQPWETNSHNLPPQK